VIEVDPDHISAPILFNPRSARELRCTDLCPRPHPSALDPSLHLSKIATIQEGMSGRVCRLERRGVVLRLLRVSRGHRGRRRIGTQNHDAQIRGRDAARRELQRFGARGGWSRRGLVDEHDGHLGLVIRKEGARARTALAGQMSRGEG
jgi:hypothetical protein